MPWTFEDAAPMIGSITEGNCWTGTHMLYSNIAHDRINASRCEVGFWSMSLLTIPKALTV